MQARRRGGQAEARGLSRVGALGARRSTVQPQVNELVVAGGLARSVPIDAAVLVATAAVFTVDGCGGRFSGESWLTSRSNLCCTLRLVPRVCGWVATLTAATWIAGSRTIRQRPLSGGITTFWA